jgi:hypothetical protein
MNQQMPIKFSPDTGKENPVPDIANEWRKFHGEIAWIYNPWTGVMRHASDIGSDTFGQLIQPIRKL